MADTDATGADDGCRRNPVEQMLDLVVFAPLGFLTESRTLLPQLAETGRQQLNQRVQLARLIGQFAVQQGQRQAVKVIGNLRSNGPTEAESEPAPSSRDAEPANGSLASPAETATSPDDATAAPEPAATIDSDATAETILASGRTPEEEQLAIPSYNSLAASQVVSRLEGLTPAELEAVRRYEEAHRGRRTVLGKIALLQSPS
jgi:hypothetical protein